MLLIINTSNKGEIGHPKALSFMLSFEICRATMAFRCGQNYTDSKNMLKT